MSWTRALALIFVGLVGCSKPQPSDQGSAIRDITPEIEAWEKANGARISPTALRLRDGSCLDVSRLPPPWTAVRDDRPLRLIIAAPRDKIEVEPAWTLGDDKRLKTRPLQVWITGWSQPPSEDFGWRGPTPRVAKENIRSGIFKPIALWPGNTLGFLAFAGPGGQNHYTDERFFSQCRDYGQGYDRLSCAIVSPDEQYIWGTDLAASNVPDLPGRIQRILDVIETMRGSCST
ncbi:hypothetical protein [Caulobacter sp. LARHSG274]